LQQQSPPNFRQSCARDAKDYWFDQTLDYPFDNLQPILLGLFLPKRSRLLVLIAQLLSHHVAGHNLPGVDNQML